MSKTKDGGFIIDDKVAAKSYNPYKKLSKKKLPKKKRK